jgi:hypothetical protein
MAFQVWLDGEPEELDSDHPSEEQMYEFEAAEKAHAVLVSSRCLVARSIEMSLITTSHTFRLSSMRLNSWRRAFQ